MRRSEPADRATSVVTAEADALATLGLAALRTDAAGRIAWVNRDFTTQFGWDALAAIGHDAADFLHPDDRGAWREILRAAPRVPAPPHHRAVLLRYGDGRFRPAHARISVSPFPEAEAGFTVVFQPAPPERLFPARPAVSRDFETCAAHELRNPLNAVIGLSHSLLEFGAAIAPERRRLYLQMIRDSGQRLLTHLDHLGELARLERGSAPEAPARLDLVALLRRTLADLPAALAAKCHALHPEVPDRPVPAFLPPATVGRALELLISRDLELAAAGERLGLGLHVIGREGVFTLGRLAAATGAQRPWTEILRDPPPAMPEPPGRQRLAFTLAATLAARAGGRVSHHPSPDGDVFVRLAFPLSTPGADLASLS